VGIAFVIPHGTAEDIIGSIRNDGEVRRGYLGAGLRTATFEMENRPGIYKSGATINNVVAGSPAEAYGLQVDDIILNINGEAVKSYQINVSIGERPKKDEIERANAIAQGLPVPEPLCRNPNVLAPRSI